MIYSQTLAPKAWTTNSPPPTTQQVGLGFNIGCPYQNTLDVSHSKETLPSRLWSEFSCLHIKGRSLPTVETGSVCCPQSVHRQQICENIADSRVWVGVFASVTYNSNLSTTRRKQQDWVGKPAVRSWEILQSNSMKPLFFIRLLRGMAHGGKFKSAACKRSSKCLQMNLYIWIERWWVRWWDVLLQRCEILWLCLMFHRHTVELHDLGNETDHCVTTYANKSAKRRALLRK